MQISPPEIFRGRNIFFIGGTGFLGKVTLSMLLERFPDIGKIYLMVRAGTGDDSEERFWNNVFTSPAFDPVREHHGDRVQEYLREKLVIVGGDITHDNLGYTEEQAQKIAGDIDLILNSSGNVSFNPPLETALKTNVTGTKNLIAFAKRMKRPAFVHTSTCFVAGNRSGQIWEDEPVIGYFPRRDELQEVQFSVEQELKDSERLTRSVVEEATDATLNAEFRTIARKRLIEEGRDPDEGNTLNLAAARERKDWIRNKMSDLGLQRAQWWGWPNIYTYTKSMAEQLIAAETEIARAIIRPAIVESSVSYPFPGWNEGFNTTAPLILFALNGQSIYPLNQEVILDIIPVDYVASAILTVAAQTIVEQPRLVYQLCSGDSNPIKLRRIVTLLGLYKRAYFQEKKTGNSFLNAIAARMEARAVEDAPFRKIVPRIRDLAQDVSEKLDESKSYGVLSGVKNQIKKAADHAEAFLREGLEAYEQFRPFTVLNKYYFRADNVRALFERLPEEDRRILTWAPETLDWYHYWVKVHFPGLNRWVFPKMEEIGKPKPKRVYTYRTLGELFDSVTKLHADRIAMRMQRKGKLEEYTYAHLREFILRAAAFLINNGIKQEDHVALIGENSPEWGITYFGIIQSGATSIPMDKDLTTDEIVNLLRAGNAKAIILSEKLQQKHSRLPKKLEEHELDVKIWTFDDVFKVDDEEKERSAIAGLPKAKPGAIASLIFTSGTTGNPKGVMLTQKNLTSMMSQLLKVYDVSQQDGFLSILPLHHTFEFSTGFLLPFSRGCQITYLEELTSDSISDAFKNSHVTMVVGVPALWDLLRRRILNRFGDKSKKLESFVKALISVNRWVREKTSVNVGPFLFYPVHHGLGGKIRFLVSGGSALSEKTYETFYGLGFSLNEGYGLTESSPVLSVTRPGAKPKIGSVGSALPGVEIKILNPNEKGIGEVIARGPNIMAGYYQNKNATNSTIIDGWLHTGDLGYIDEDGNLFLVGRSKDLILGPSGKNVYPDEIEDLYRDSPYIKELSVVGLPDHNGERIACLVVPDYEHEKSLSHEHVRSNIEDHFKKIASGLPVWKRITSLDFQDEELPRTGTRKVKRREVIKILQERHAKATAPIELPASSEFQALTELISSVCGRPVEEIHRDTTFDELGFDSLMYSELGAAIEHSGRVLPSFEALGSITSVRQLADFLHVSSRTHAVAKRTAKAEETEEEITLPGIIGDVGGAALDLANEIFYNSYLHAEISGTQNIPVHTNFIVAPNHSSHLDTGLVKKALGDAGKNLAALAAKDYFFNNKLKRTFFENFTNLIPMEREGSIHESLKLAVQTLQKGFNLLIFPEGTRSTSGQMTEFKSSLGYLALRAKRGILPIYLGGTHEAMPKGAKIIKKKNVKAAIGPYLEYEALEKFVEGMPRNDAYRLITLLVEQIVRKLKHGPVAMPDLTAVRNQWNRENQPKLQESASALGD